MTRVPVISLRRVAVIIVLTLATVWTIGALR